MLLLLLHLVKLQLNKCEIRKELLNDELRVYKWLESHENFYCLRRTMRNRSSNCETAREEKRRNQFEN